MITEVLTVDVAAGVATYEGQQVDVAIAILTHIESGATVWESGIAVPFVVDDWLARVLAHMSTVKVYMEAYWPETAAYTCWWLVEPGVDENNPHGIMA